MTKCIIFGGNGFIGSHLAVKLAENGYEVCIFDKFSCGVPAIPRNNIKLIKGNFFDSKAVDESLKGVDYVFHFISATNPATSMKDPIYDIESNVIGSVKLFQSCIKNDVDKIIFSSSGGTIYGNPMHVPVKETDPCNPINPYAIGKLTIEKYIKYFNYLYGIDYKILRYSNPYGEGQNPQAEQGVIPIFLNKIKHNECPVVYGDGSAVRDYIYIKDAIEATFDLVTKETNFKTFNIGSGAGISIRVLVKVISYVIGKDVKLDFRENPPAYIPKIILDVSRLTQETGWKPRWDIYKGVERTWEWINKLQ